MKESLRVLKKGGVLVTAYIPRYYVFQYIAMQNSNFLDAKLANQIIQTDELHHDDEKCFWTDTYYSTCEEMEQLYQQYGVTVIDHFSQDGATPHFQKKLTNGMMRSLRYGAITTIVSAGKNRYLVQVITS